MSGSNQDEPIRVLISISLASTDAAAPLRTQTHRTFDGPRSSRVANRADERKELPPFLQSLAFPCGPASHSFACSSRPVHANGRRRWSIATRLPTRLAPASLRARRKQRGTAPVPARARAAAIRRVRLKTDRRIPRPSLAAAATTAPWPPSSRSPWLPRFGSFSRLSQSSAT